MKNNLQWIALCAMLILFCTCQQEEKHLSSDKEIVSFSILQKDNPDKTGEDIKASVRDGVITLTVQEYDDLKSLVATFEYSGRRVTVGGVEQTSEVTANDYSRPLIFTVEAEDGSKVVYTVKVNQQKINILSLFAFQQKDNPALSFDASCAIGEGTITSARTFPIGKLVAAFTTNAVKVMVGNAEQESEVTENDFSSPVTYRFVMCNGEEIEQVVTLEVLINAIPKLDIVTDDPSITEIQSKDTYLSATLIVDGQGGFDNYKGKTKIKGRGNSTWGYPKKPYRLKLDEKSEICGLGKAKNFVLLANYLDPTLMLNSVAFKIGHLVGLPFTNHAVPVDVYLNHQYKGSYLLTEQVEVYESRVNISKDNGVIWELDSYFDEDLKFKTTAFNLPVMLKDPDMDDRLFNFWKDDFNAFAMQFSKNPIEGNSYVDLIDIESVANYLIVYNLTQNMEINHPKSTYIHKEGTGKYVMGPIWDFDWAFGYEGDEVHFTNVSRSMFDKNLNNGIGQAFFERFLSDSRVRAIYKKNWNRFRNENFQTLIRYIDSYAKILKPSIEKDSKMWSNTRNFDTKVKELKTWLNARADYIDKQIAGY